VDRKVSNIYRVISLVIILMLVLTWFSLDTFSRMSQSNLETNVASQEKLANQISGRNTPTFTTVTVEGSDSQSNSSTQLGNNSVYPINLSQDTINYINQETANNPSLITNLTQSVLDLIKTLGISLPVDLSGLLIGTSNILDQAVTSVKILDGTIDTLDIALGSITNGLLANDSVDASKIISGAVNTAEIALGAITNPLLAANAVGSLNIINGSILGGDIANSTIDTVNMAANSITTSLIQDGAVELIDLDSNSVDSSKIVDGAVALIDLGSDSVDASKIINGAVGNLELANGAVDSSKILDGAITGLDIASGTITSSNILNGTILGTNLANGAIGALQISDGAITTLKIAPGSITNSLLAASSVNSSNIVDGSIGAIDIALGAITGSLIANNTISSTNIVNGAIGTLQLGNSVVTTSKLSTASNTKTVSVQLGNITSVVSDVERPVFIAPTAGTITKISFTNAAGLAIGGGTISIERKTAPTATVASTNLGLISLGAFTPQSPTLGSGTSFNAGDVYTFLYDVNLASLGLTGFLVTIEYIPSE